MNDKRLKNKSFKKCDRNVLFSAALVFLKEIVVRLFGIAVKGEEHVADRIAVDFEEQSANRLLFSGDIGTMNVFINPSAGG